MYSGAEPLLIWQGSREWAAEKGKESHTAQLLASGRYGQDNLKKREDKWEKEEQKKTPKKQQTTTWSKALPALKLLQKLLSNRGLKLEVPVLTAGVFSSIKRQGLSWKGEEEEGEWNQKMNEKASVS